MTKKTYTVSQIAEPQLQELVAELELFAQKKINYNEQIQFIYKTETFNGIDFIKRLAKKDKLLAHQFITQLPVNLWDKILDSTEKEISLYELLFQLDTKTQIYLLGHRWTQEKLIPYTHNVQESFVFLEKNKSVFLSILKTFPTPVLKKLLEYSENYRDNLFAAYPRQKENEKEVLYKKNMGPVAFTYALASEINLIASYRQKFESILWAQDTAAAHNYYTENKEYLNDNYHYAELAFHFYEQNQKPLSDFLFTHIEDIFLDIPRHPTSHKYPVSRQILSLISDKEKLEAMCTILSPKRQAQFVETSNEWLMKDLVANVGGWDKKDTAYLAQLGFSFQKIYEPEKQQEIFQELEFSLQRQASYSSKREKIEEKITKLESLHFPTQTFLKKTRFLHNFIPQEKSNLENITFFIQKYPAILKQLGHISYDNSAELNKDTFLLYSPLALAVLSNKWEVANWIVSQVEPAPTSYPLFQLNAEKLDKQPSPLAIVYHYRNLEITHYDYLIKHNLLRFEGADPKELERFLFEHLLRPEAIPQATSNLEFINLYQELFEKITTKLSASQKKTILGYLEELEKNKNTSSSSYYTRATQKLLTVSNQNESPVLEKLKLLLSIDYIPTTARKPHKI